MLPKHENLVVTFDGQHVADLDIAGIGFVVEVVAKVLGKRFEDAGLVEMVLAPFDERVSGTGVVGLKVDNVIGLQIVPKMLAVLHEGFPVNAVLFGFGVSGFDRAKRVEAGIFAEIAAILVVVNGPFFGIFDG